MSQVIAISSVLLWAVVVFNLLLTFALIRQRTTGTTKSDILKAGQPAPDFSAETLLGETVTLSDYAGQEVAFLFIVT